jgi:hypothetical protein
MRNSNVKNPTLKFRNRLPVHGKAQTEASSEKERIAVYACFQTQQATVLNTSVGTVLCNVFAEYLKLEKTEY